MSRLAPWDDSMSDGCSVPAWLRWLVREETLRERQACVEHDRAYYYGGGEIDRLRADIALRNALREAGMPAALTWAYFAAVRAFGHPMWRRRRGWAYGGRRYAYEISN